LNGQLRNFAEQAGAQERAESSKGTTDANSEAEQQQSKAETEQSGKADAEETQRAAGEDGSHADKSEEPKAEEAEPERELTPVEKLEKELEEVTEKSTKKKRELLLALADFENNKKKFTKEREGRRSRASANFARSMVEVYGEFEALPSLNVQIEGKEEGNACIALQEGVALTRQLFASALEKTNIERIPIEIGQPVVAARHEVVGSVAGDGNQPKASIAEVTDAGWIMDLRSSSPVVVQKAKVKTVGAA
jgi:molecular chaperone GrpE (heat shock protein)